MRWLYFPLAHKRTREREKTDENALRYARLLQAKCACGLLKPARTLLRGSLPGETTPPPPARAQDEVRGGGNTWNE